MTSPQPKRPAWHAVVPLVMLLAGLLFGTAAAVAQHEGSVGRPTDLVGLIRERTEHLERLVSRSEELTAEVEQLGAARNPVDESRLAADAIAPEIGAGPVAGPALRVTLDDAGYSLDTLPDGYTVDDVVVHQQDVQSVINAMWAGGAEAMMVQDQRIVATSSVQCVGNTLYLQGRVYSPPYTITAIGDVGGMERALTDDPVVANYRAWAEILGLGYAVDRLGETEFPGFAGSLRAVHAAVLEPESVPTEPTTDGPEE